MIKTHIINYFCNKYCPYIILLIALFLNSGIKPLNALVILASCFFIDKFSFKTGYSVAYCESNNIDLEKEYDD
jgi:ABC-type polysaccharide/polyol phosphate export permease